MAPPGQHVSLSEKPLQVPAQKKRLMSLRHDVGGKWFFSLHFHTIMTTSCCRRSVLVLVLLLPFTTSFTVASTSSTMPSSYEYLNDVSMGPPDAILGIAQAFRACDDPRKVNVCVGAYRDENGQPWVLPSVRKAEEIMKDENKEYLPIEGDAAFVTKALTFAYGSDAPLDRIAGVQSLSGTGACRIGGEFLGKFLPKGTRIYIPDPT